ncbi:MAG: hypothetical protein CMH49_00130 [Myxococcales bacterium]|nr:hypothetical protein [Myxococcales bacterium]
MYSETLWKDPEYIAYFLAILVSVITVELLLTIKWSTLLARLLKGVKLTLIALFDDSLQDEQKEIALRKAAFAMLSVSFKTLFLFLAIIGVFYLDSPLKALALSNTSHHSVSTDLSWTILLLIKSMVAMVYWLIRIKLIKTSNKATAVLKAQSDQSYSVISKALHDLALDSPLIARMSLELEKKRYLNKDQLLSTSSTSQKPIWVCGLARAGTTILTDVLYETGLFTSLTYRQMPFPLAPNVWKKLSRWGISGIEQKVERAHGDGILVSINSPEALEEVFWRVYESHVYQQTESLSVHQSSPESLLAFEEYLSCILQLEDQSSLPAKRYLSKNNNHLIRLPSLLGHFPLAKILVPLREPLEHAESLRRQHQKWVERHQEDPFSLSYMNWLSHHEFGLGHKPFSFAQDSAHTQGEISSESTDPHSLTYWLIRWIEAYSYVESVLAEPRYQSQILIVEYDALSSEPSKVLSNIFSYLDLAIEQKEVLALAERFKVVPKRAERKSVDPSLLNKAEGLYRRLSE